MVILKRITLFGLTFVMALAGLDLYLQLAEIQSPMETRIDPHMGRTYIPNKHIIRFDEGFFLGSVNEFGYMGTAVPPRRREGERRILLFGDSYVLGHTVLPRHYFGRHLEAYLRQAAGGEIHALNFGKADFSINNMYQIYVDFAGKFDHDLALFLVSKEDLAPNRQFLSDLYPKVRLEGEALVIDRSFRFSRAYHFYRTVSPVLARSAVLRLAVNSLRLIERNRWMEVAFDKLAALIAPREDKATQMLKNLDRLPTLTRTILKELAKDPRNILVTYVTVEPEFLDDIRSTGIPIIELGVYLESLQAEGIDPFYYRATRLRGHWNHAAHERIGWFLSQEIIKRGGFGAAGKPKAPRR
jgi:hypothetical protein